MFVAGDHIGLGNELDCRYNVPLCNFHPHLSLYYHLSVRFDYVQLVHCSEHFDDFASDGETAAAAAVGAAAAAVAAADAAVAVAPAFVAASVHAQPAND